MNKISCIYKITNPQGKVYIGQTIDWERRKKEYMKRERASQVKLYRSFNKYGKENHVFEVLHECTVSQLDTLECYYIDVYNSIELGLNAKGGGLGGYMPQDVRDKISLKHKNKVVSDSTKEKLRQYAGVKHHAYGSKLPESVKQKMRDKALQRKHNPETKEKLRALNIGGNSPNAKMVINLENGIFYDSPRDAANVFSYNLVTLRCWLNGSLKNKTNYSYC
jgi:group I intron endonuclease